MAGEYGYGFVFNIAFYPVLYRSIIPILLIIYFIKSEKSSQKIKSMESESVKNLPSDNKNFFCTKCGKQIAEDSDFCVHCGSKIIK